jgi:hypothetical protein
MKNNAWAVMILLSSFASSYATSVSACSAPASIEHSNQELREALNRADNMFIGQVQRVTMRRWTDDDQMGPYEQRLLEAQAEGRELDETERHFVTFSDAEARLSIETSMKLDGLDQRPPDPIVDFGLDELDVDLLDHGSFCHDFPRPCPWDLKAGDWVAVALEVQPSQSPVTFYCVKIDHPNLAQNERIKALRGIVEPAEVFWPFLGANHGDWPFDETADAPPATLSVSIKPRRRPASHE